MLIKTKPVSFQMCLSFFLITFVNIRKFDTKLSILHSEFLSLYHMENFRENICFKLIYTPPPPEKGSSRNGWENE